VTGAGRLPRSSSARTTSASWRLPGVIWPPRAGSSARVRRCSSRSGWHGSPYTWSRV